MSLILQAYNVKENFKYPQNLFLINGWYPNNWWEGNKQDQEELQRIYNCNSEQRKSLIPYTLSILTAGLEPVNFSSVGDSQYVCHICTFIRLRNGLFVFFFTYK